jgi:hypothetical protein
LTENLTFWTVALMVDRRQRMWRSRRNAIVLLFTCLIRMSDGSRINSLFLVVFSFLLKKQPTSPVRLSLCAATAALPLAYSILPSPRWGRTTVERVERRRDPHRVQEVSSLQLLSLYLPHCINFPVRVVIDLLRFEGFTDLIWVGNQNESCRYFQYLSIEYLFTNFGGVF